MKEHAGALAQAEERESRREDLAQAVHVNLDTALKLSRLQPQSLSGRLGMSLSQFIILSEIQREPGIRINDIARRRSITASTASNLLDKMEARGLVRRERSHRDKRVVRLFITGEGRKVIKRFPATAHGPEASALALIPDVMLLGLNRHLEVVISSLRLIRARAARPGHAARGRPARASRR